MVDGRFPEMYSGDGSGDFRKGVMVPYPAPTMEFGDCVVEGGRVVAVVLLIRRELPLSSSQGSCPMRFGISVGNEVLVSSPFMVHSKRSKTTPKIRRPRPVALPSPSRSKLLADVLAAVKELEDAPPSKSRKLL